MIPLPFLLCTEAACDLQCALDAVKRVQITRGGGNCGRAPRTVDSLRMVGRHWKIGACIRCQSWLRDGLAPRDFLGTRRRSRRRRHCTMAGILPSMRIPPLSAALCRQLGARATTRAHRSQWSSWLRSYQVRYNSSGEFVSCDYLLRPWRHPQSQCITVYIVYFRAQRSISAARPICI